MSQDVGILILALLCLVLADLRKLREENGWALAWLVAALCAFLTYGVLQWQALQ